MSALAYQIATWLIPLVMAIVLHEIAHGWVALAFGDPTAKEQGRLTPNPIRHADPIGTVAVPLVLAISGAPVFGWAKPVPVIAERLRNPRLHMMLVALAGPGTNLVLAFLASLGVAMFSDNGLVAADTATQFAFATLRNFIVINVFLAVFNLLPLPPFDGGHVVEGLLPRRAVPGYRRIGRFGFPLAILLIVVLPMLSPRLDIVSRVVLPPVRWLLERLG